MLLATFLYNGIKIEIWGTQEGDNVKLEIKSEGSDLNYDIIGLAIDFDNDGGPLSGAGVPNFQGSSNDDVQFDGWDFISQTGQPGEGDGVFLNGFVPDLVPNKTLAEFNGAQIALRLQSVGDDGEGSLKLDEIVVIDNGGGGGDPLLCFDGLSQGYWSQHAFAVFNKQGKEVQQADAAWAELGTGSSYEDFFGIDAFGALDLSLHEAITTGGGGEAALARQAVAAVLNAEKFGDAFAFSVDEIKEAVQTVYQYGFGADTDGDGVADWEELKDVLEFYNTIRSYDADGNGIADDYDPEHGVCLPGDSPLILGSLDDFLQWNQIA
jgi:hypothetical protein